VFEAVIKRKCGNDQEPQDEQRADAMFHRQPAIGLVSAADSGGG
jgi:hypothetical protein